MNTVPKLAAFGIALAVVFGASAAVGAAVGPIDVGGHPTAHSGDDRPSADAVEQSATTAPRGLSLAQDGFRLVIETGEIAGGIAQDFSFQIVGNDGAVVTDFDELHERDLHLIVLSRNLVDYLHVHPEMDVSGRWTVELPGLAGGSYRVFADFQPTGADNITLGSDVVVAGDVPEVAKPGPSISDEVDDLTVTLEAEPVVGETELTFTVERDGRPIRTEPYLGADGHLVAIRDGDLAYLHVHPHDPGQVGVTFTGEFPTPGSYRLFFDFSVGGIVRTADFTVVVSGSQFSGMANDHEEH